MAGSTGFAWALLCQWLLADRSFAARAGAQAAGLLGIIAAAAWAIQRSYRRMDAALKEAEHQAQLAEARLWEYFNTMPVGAMLVSPDGAVLQCNRKALEILGLPEEMVLGVNWREPDIPVLQADGNPLPFEELPTNKALLERRKTGAVTLGVERPSDGDWSWCSIVAEPHLDEQGEVLDILMTFEDVTQRRMVEAELAIQTFRDRLTSLPNRTLFMERLTQAILRCDRRKLSTAVLFLDLDRFKVVNDSLSHESGDQLLVQVAKRIRGSIRPEDTAARLGGDEFAVLFEDLAHVNGAMRVAERILRAFDEPFQLTGQEVFTTCSMGLATSSSSDTNPSELIRDAEVAMYRAKAKGEGTIEHFDPSMNAQALARFQLEGELRRALERNEFFLMYQPIVGLDSGVIEGWEALVRWRHPERGLVPPLDFIPLAEETGLIVPIGKWVLEEACRQAKLWLDRFPTRLERVMNVNISSRQFQNRDLIATVTEALTSQDLRPRNLKLEITESMMMKDPQASIEAMTIFKGLHVFLVVDDFGTGYSSLSYLKRFPVDTLKVDKSFVDGLGTDAESTAIVEAIISLAKSLGMRVTAEGIETKEQLERLRALGCDYGQGYFLSRPLATEAMDELLARNPSW